MLSRSTTGSSGINLGGAGGAGLSAGGGQMAWQQTEAAGMTHQHITETAHKRISTLDYLRKAHEGRLYWFNTYLFDKQDLARMPSFDPRRSGRRATNYLLLGLSLPIVVDLNSSTPVEFLRGLNTLLGEFESFQQLRGDGSGSAGSGLTGGSLSRARLPQMFRRAASATAGSRSRRAPSTDQSMFGDDPAGIQDEGTAAAGTVSGVMAFAASESDLLPGEEYTLLLTPSLPFEPDFFETFATLCDVLIDCYQRLLSLVPAPRDCAGPVAELFAKADVKIRKIIVSGIVREFEDSSRAQVKSEVASVGMAVLGGLI